MNIFDIILLKYPGIQRVSYWQTKTDGTPWDDPYDGLVWENIDIPKPTKKELAQWKIDVDLSYRQEEARKARIYPTIQEQLDMMYNDAKNSTTVWKDTIAAIKAATPIPTK